MWYTRPSTDFSAASNFRLLIPILHGNVQVDFRISRAEMNIAVFTHRSRYDLGIWRLISYYGSLCLHSSSHLHSPKTNAITPEDKQISVLENGQDQVDIVGAFNNV